MSNHSRQIVQKLWNYCNVFRDDGLSNGDDVEQLTLLLFLKENHEARREPRLSGELRFAGGSQASGPFFSLARSSARY